MPLPDRHDCHACIEDFGVRHQMIAIAVLDAEPIRLCDYHDVRHADMTIANLDPHGVMKDLAC